MFESVRIKTKDEQTAVTLAHDLLARFRPQVDHEATEWVVRLDSESDDDLIDILDILRARLHAADPIDVLIDGEPYLPPRGP